APSCAGRRGGSRRGPWPSCPTSRPTAARSTSAASGWRRATRSSSTSWPCTGHPASPTRAAAGYCRCATCRPAPGTRRAGGSPRRPSTASTRSCPPGRPWTTPCSRWCGRRRPGSQTFIQDQAALGFKTARSVVTLVYVYDFDILVIGSGPGGQKAAIAAAQLGRQVAIIERKDMVGGGCLNTRASPAQTPRGAALYPNRLDQREG